MAKLKFSRNEILNRITLEINTKELEREVFGLFRWRLRLGVAVMKLGVKIIGVKGIVDRNSGNASDSARGSGPDCSPSV